MSISPCIQLFSVGPNEDLVLSQGFRPAKRHCLLLLYGQFFFLVLGLRFMFFLCMAEIK